MVAGRNGFDLSGLKGFYVRDPGLRSADSLQPGLSHDGLSALKLRAQNRSERGCVCETSRSTVRPSEDFRIHNAPFLSTRCG